MSVRKIIGILLIGLSMVFATFFREWVQSQLGNMFSDYSLFLSAPGRFGVELFFLLPLFTTFGTATNTNKWLQWMLGFFLVRFVLALITYFLTDSVAGSVAYTVLSNFYGVAMDIALLYIVIRYFNQQEQPFVARAALLIWGILSLGSFALPGTMDIVVDLLIHTTFVIGMLIVLNHLIEPFESE